jgi:lysophospholipase L1-like esterase
VSGRLFEDRDGDGIWVPGEPGLAEVPVGVLGTLADSTPFDEQAITDPNGLYSLAPGDGCYVLDLADPEGWRLGPTRRDRVAEGTPGYGFPVGRSRFGKLDHGGGHLRALSLDYAAMGDSIAWNFNVCSYPERFWYSRQVRSRLACVAPTASISLIEAAEKGEHTDDLLEDDSDNSNNVFRMMELQPDWITLSMVGNDLLNVDVDNPTQEETNRAVAEVLDARRNLQEALSVLVSEIPHADLALNSLYDNLAYNCPSVATSEFHRTWVPIIDQILRDLAWGQTRRVSVIEAAAEFGQEGLLGACTGFEGLICRALFGLDQIHPDNDGYQVMREKVWEAAGGALLGSGDPLNRGAMTADYGFLRRVRRLLPTGWALLAGAAVTAPEAALSPADSGAAASITLGAGAEEFRLFGFPFWFDDVQIVKVIAGVRYRTTGQVTDDYYRVEASPSGQFEPPPDFDFTPVNWNFSTPMVGGGGPNQPPENADYPDARLLALPDVPVYREVSATLTKNPVLLPDAEDYSWPPINGMDLATSAIRVVAAPVAGTTGNDDYTVELDAAWLDLYGWEKTRPPEVADLRLELQADGDLDLLFQALPGAQRYNVYTGRIATLPAGYDHGAGAPAGPHCGLSTQDAGGGRRRATLTSLQQAEMPFYVLVTAHVDDVESPAGRASSGIEIDRSQSVCW